jgi:hypothetical protein
MPGCKTDRSWQILPTGRFSLDDSNTSSLYLTCLRAAPDGMHHDVTCHIFLSFHVARLKMSLFSQSTECDAKSMAC